MAAGSMIVSVGVTVGIGSDVAVEDGVGVCVGRICVGGATVFVIEFVSNSELSGEMVFKGIGVVVGEVSVRIAVGVELAGMAVNVAV